MILFAAIVPAPPVLRAVEDAVRANGAHALTMRPLDNLHLPVARFGNTSASDAERLVGILRTAAQDWSPIRLSLGGASVVETPRERILCTEVRGDVEALARLCLDTKQAAERLRFLLDRRDFNPVLTLASTRVGAVSDIDAAAAALTSFESDSWLVTEVSMRKQTHGSEGASEEIAWIPLGPD